MGGAPPKPGNRGLMTVGVGVVLVAALVVGPTKVAGQTTPLFGTVDLSLESTVEPSAAAPGSVVRYESFIHNRGTLTADTVRVFFEVPAATVSIEAGTRSCTTVGSMRLESGGVSEEKPWTVICNLGALPPGAQTPVSLSVTAGTPGTQLATVTVVHDGADARPEDNQVELPVFVLPETAGVTPAFQQPGRLNSTPRTAA